MDTLKTIFPFSFKAKDISSLVVILIAYLVIDIICGVIIGLLAKLPIIGILFALVGSVVGLYALVGIILAILYFVKVIE